MEQHPIPQQISSYQFKLVGDMTLKQFFQVAGGVVISLIFYSLPLHGLIKWPLILLSAKQQIQAQILKEKEVHNKISLIAPTAEELFLLIAPF